MMVSLPGHGHSDLPPVRYRDYIEQARIVYEAIEQARRKHGLTGPIYVLGHSHGGGMAEALALVAGDEISRYYILAGVGGPEWTRVAGVLKRGLNDLRHGRILTDDVAQSWQRLSGFVSDGYIIVPPPWELAGWRAELIRPFTRGLHGESLTNLYSVMVDTLLDDAAQLEDCLASMGRLAAPTVILAGKADGVITREVIRSQAVAAAKSGQISAPVFHSSTTHAGFLASRGRNYVADMVTMDDDALTRAVASHCVAA
jgi:pimeloyl-ACP methyl ester carboxylesterase